MLLSQGVLEYFSSVLLKELRRDRDVSTVQAPQSLTAIIEAYSSSPGYDPMLPEGARIPSQQPCIGGNSGNGLHRAPRGKAHSHPAILSHSARSPSAPTAGFNSRKQGQSTMTFCCSRMEQQRIHPLNAGHQSDKEAVSASPELTVRGSVALVALAEKG